MVAVRVHQEVSVVRGAVFPAQARRAVVAATGQHAGRVEQVHGRACRCGEGQVEAFTGRRRIGTQLQAQDVLVVHAAVADRVVILEHAPESQRAHGAVVEGAAGGQVAHAQRQVVQHGRAHDAVPRSSPDSLPNSSPSSLPRASAAFTAATMAGLTPPCSMLVKAAYVVPPSDVTRSRSSATGSSGLAASSAALVKVALASVRLWSGVSLSSVPARSIASIK